MIGTTIELPDCQKGQHHFEVENVLVCGGVYVICWKCGEVLFKELSNPNRQKFVFEGSAGGDPNNPFPLKRKEKK